MRIPRPARRWAGRRVKRKSPLRWGLWTSDWPLLNATSESTRLCPLFQARGHDGLPDVMQLSRDYHWKVDFKIFTWEKISSWGKIHSKFSRYVFTHTTYGSSSCMSTRPETAMGHFKVLSQAQYGQNVFFMWFWKAGLVVKGSPSGAGEWGSDPSSTTCLLWTPGSH